MLNRAGAPEAAEQIIGPSAVMVMHAAFLKPARVGTPVAAHQDQALWSAEYPGAFSMWMALTSVSQENGGLYGYPGSHAGGVIPHAPDPAHPWHDALTHVANRLGRRHDFRLQPGDAAVWDRAFVYASEANTADNDRRGMVV